MCFVTNPGGCISLTGYVDEGVAMSKRCSVDEGVAMNKRCVRVVVSYEDQDGGNRYLEW